MKELLKLAREAISSSLEERELIVKDDIKKEFSEKKACFVTLTFKANKELRGCIGNLEARQELWKEVIENARDAAFSDSRFLPLSKEELEKIKIEVSVLSTPKKIDYEDSKDLKKKIMGKGVIIQRGFNQATYLPQVWQQLPVFLEFISSLCEKAGLSSSSWKKLDLEVWTYSVEKIEEK